MDSEIERAKSHLDRVKRAILTGQYSLLESLTAESERLLARAQSSPAFAQDLKGPASRVFRLLEQARLGLEDGVLKHKATIRSANFNNYSADGSREVLTPQPARIQHKA